MLRSMGNLKKEDVLKYFSDLSSHYASYHNHKETSAWASVALYLLVVIQIGGTTGTDAGWIERCGRGAVILVIGLVINQFVKTQFKMRKFAGDIVAACLDLHREHLSADNILAEHFALEDQTAETDHQSFYFLPRIVLEKRKQYESRGGKVRRRLEDASYFLLGIIGVAGIIIVWLK